MLMMMFMLPPERVSRRLFTRHRLGLPGRVGQSSSGTPKVPAVALEKGGSHGKSSKRLKSTPSSSSHPSPSTRPPWEKGPPLPSGRLTSPITGGPLGLTVDEISIYTNDCAHFYENPYDFSIHMVKTAKKIDVGWKAQTGHDFDAGVRADKGRLVAENECLTAERDACMKKLEEIQGQLRFVHRELEGARNLLGITRAEQESTRADKEVIDEKLRKMAGKVADCRYHGYQKALDHVKFVYPQRVSRMSSSILTTQPRMESSSSIMTTGSTLNFFTLDCPCTLFFDDVAPFRTSLDFLMYFVHGPGLRR